MKPQDINLDVNYDLNIVNGDFDLEDCNELDADLIVNTSRGNWKQYPLVGMGLSQFIEADVDKKLVDQLNADGRLQLQADGFVVNGFTLLLSPEGIAGITVDADRNI